MYFYIDLSNGPELETWARNLTPVQAHLFPSLKHIPFHRFIVTRASGAPPPPLLGRRRRRRRAAAGEEERRPLGWAPEEEEGAPKGRGRRRLVARQWHWSLFLMQPGSRPGVRVASCHCWSIGRVHAGASLVVCT